MPGPRLRGHVFGLFSGSIFTTEGTEEDENTEKTEEEAIILTTESTEDTEEEMSWELKKLIQSVTNIFLCLCALRALCG